MDLLVIEQKIFEVRECKVMLDSDLATLYGVPTKSLNLAVKRNLKRFPLEFMFQLTKDEFETLRFQIETSKRGGRRYLPYVFTEHGVAMLSSVLNSERAIEINISIIKAFILLRKYAKNYKELQIKMEDLETKYNKNFEEIYKALKLLLSPEYKRKPIGYKIGTQK